MKFRLIFAILMLAIAAMPAFSQKDYDKPAEKWSKEAALSVLQESPWAKQYQSTTGQAGAAAGTVAREQSQSANRGGSDPRSVARDFGPPPVTVLLHSSEVVRKATIRLRQLDAGYDKMSAEDKAKFDASQKIFMDCAICKDYYVVKLSKATFSKGGGIDEGIFQGMTLDELRGNIKLVNDAGEERELIQYNPAKSATDTAVFYFKRADANGKHLVTPETKSFRVVFSNDFLDAKNRFAYLLPRSFEFKVSKMIVGDKLLF